MDQAVGMAATALGLTLRFMLVAAGWVRPAVGPAFVVIALFWIWPPLALLAIGVALTLIEWRRR